MYIAKPVYCDRILFMEIYMYMNSVSCMGEREISFYFIVVNKNIFSMFDNASLMQIILSRNLVK